MPHWLPMRMMRSNHLLFIPRAALSSLQPTTSLPHHPYSSTASRHHRSRNPNNNNNYVPPPPPSSGVEEKKSVSSSIKNDAVVVGSISEEGAHLASGYVRESILTSPPPPVLHSQAAEGKKHSNTQSPSSTSLDRAEKWEYMRLEWLATGSITTSSRPSPSQQQQQQNVQEFTEKIAEERRKLAKKRSAKPIRVNEKNILNALRDPSRLMEFNRNLPLKSMVSIARHLWIAEERAQMGGTVHAEPPLA